MKERGFLGDGVVADIRQGQGSNGDVAQFDASPLLELGGEAGVDRRELGWVVAGQDDPAPDPVCGASGDGVVAAASPEGAVTAPADRDLLFVRVEKQFGVLAARQVVTGVEQAHVGAQLKDRARPGQGTVVSRVVVIRGVLLCVVAAAPRRLIEFFAGARGGRITDNLTEVLAVLAVLQLEFLLCTPS